MENYLPMVKEDEVEARSKDKEDKDEEDQYIDRVSEGQYRDV